MNKKKREKDKKRYWREAKRGRGTEEEDLREDALALDVVEEGRADLAVEDVMDEVLEQPAVVLERLERYLLRYVIRRVRHPSGRSPPPPSSSPAIRKTRPPPLASTPPPLNYDDGGVSS